MTIPSCKDGCLPSRKVRVLPLKRKRRDNRRNWQFCHKWVKSEGSAELEPKWLLFHLIKVLRGSTFRSGLCAVWSMGFSHISCYSWRFLKLLEFLKYRHVTGRYTKNSIRASSWAHWPWSLLSELNSSAYLCLLCAFDGLLDSSAPQKADGWGISELSAQSSAWSLGQLPLSPVVFLIHTMWMERLEELGSHPFLLHCSGFRSQDPQQLSQILRVRKANGYYFCVTGNFSPENVNDTARETCLNWFFKIASIRELIPRLYPSLLILKRRKALHHERGPDIVVRSWLCVVATWAQASHILEKPWDPGFPLAVFCFSLWIWCRVTRLLFLVRDNPTSVLSI